MFVHMDDLLLPSHLSFVDEVSGWSIFQKDSLLTGPFSHVILYIPL